MFLLAGYQYTYTFSAVELLVPITA